MSLQGKRILIAITGSIAAYKTPDLVRKFIKQGASVQVIITPSATEFVSTLSLATVSKNEVFHSIADNSQWHNHVALGRWADLMLITPCSANTLSKMANGQCDNLLLAVYLSATCPIVIAPAMDEDMWLHSSTKNNIQKVKSYGNHIIAPESGELASGLIGPGRMAEPETIVEWATHFLNIDKNTAPKALITAGPTFEAIDPVRFIGNHSTGKMGIALAESLASRGHLVTLILGPTHLKATHTNITTIPVVSADEMYEATTNAFEDCELAILAAAVADFKPEHKATEKIKKGNDTTMQLNLVKNKDILAHLGSIKKDTQILVGFALETNNIFENAQKKRIQKNADYIVLNTLQDAGAGFGHDTNKVYIISKDPHPKTLELQSKTVIASEIVNYILSEKK